jgi:translation initiation factor 2-alpha kinase 4
MSVNSFASNKPKLFVKSVFAASVAVWLLSSDEDECKQTANGPSNATSSNIQPTSTDSKNDRDELQKKMHGTFLGRPLSSFKSEIPTASLNAYYRPSKRLVLPSPPRTRTIQISGCVYNREFHELGKLGSGAYGSVYRTQNLLDGNTYAVKKIFLPLSIPKHFQLDHHGDVGPLMIPDDIKYILREPQVMASVCKHSNVVRYHHSWLELIPSTPKNTTEPLHHHVLPPSKPLESLTSSAEDGSWNDGYDSVEEEDNDDEILPTANPSILSDYSLVLFIQMELCSGASLYDWLRLPGRIVNAIESQKLFKQLIQGLAHLHAKGYCHRDVKPANLLIVPKEGDNKLKVGDFGCCKRLEDEDKVERISNSSPDHTQGCGTFFYMAPELHTNRYDTMVDIFAAGIVLFELYNVFSTEMERHQMLTQLHEKRLVPRKFVKTYPNEAHLILKMTHSDPTQRPSAFELLNNPRFGLCPIQDLDNIIPE